MMGQQGFRGLWVAGQGASLADPVCWVVGDYPDKNTSLAEVYLCVQRQKQIHVSRTWHLVFPTFVIKSGSSAVVNS